jgi:hypothetical protein
MVLCMTHSKFFLRRVSRKEREKIQLVITARFQDEMDPALLLATSTMCQFFSLAAHRGLLYILLIPPDTVMACY